MDGPRDYHTKWSKPDRERQISYNITYLWDIKKNDTNELKYETEVRPTDLENKFIVTTGRSGGGIN